MYFSDRPPGHGRRYKLLLYIDVCAFVYYAVQTVTRVMGVEINKFVKEGWLGGLKCIIIMMSTMRKSPGRERRFYNVQ